nr:splicing factor 3B subunit 1-like protein [Cryptomonas curvata]
MLKIYKALLEKILPSIQHGYYYVFHLSCYNFLNLETSFKKLLKSDCNSVTKFSETITCMNVYVKKQSKLEYIKRILFLFSVSKNTHTIKDQLLKFNYFLLFKQKYVSYNLDTHSFAIELLLFSKCHKIRQFSSKLLVQLLTINELYNILIYLQIKMNHKNKNIRVITSEILNIIKKTESSNILGPFLRCLFLYKKKWRIRYTICKTIQKSAKKHRTFTFNEREEYIFICERSLRDSRNIIKINGAKLTSLLFKIHDINSLYLPCLILPLFDGLRKYKGNIFFIFLKGIKIFLKYYFLKIPVLLLSEIIEITLKLIKSGKNNLISIKSLACCFKNRILDKNYVKVNNFLAFTLILEYNFPILYNNKTHIFINGLISLCQKNILKRVLCFILIRFFNKNYCVINNILRLTRGLIIEYGKKTKISFNLVSNIFIYALRTIDRFFYYTKNVSSLLQLKLYHRILESIINNFHIFSNYFLPQLSRRLKCELKAHKSAFRRQAAITIKIISKKMKTIEKKKFIFEFGVILFENLNEIKPKLLSQIILAYDYMLNNLSLDEYIPPPDILILELASVLKNRQKVVTRILSKCIWKIINRGFLFLSKKKWVNICLDLGNLANSIDFVTKKYCICLIFKIAKIIGPIETIKITINQRGKNEKPYYFSLTTMYSLFLEMFGWQNAFQILISLFKKMDLISEFFEIKTLMYVIWYLPKEKMKYYFNILFTFLRKISEQKKKKESCCFYILTGLFAKKSQNNENSEYLNELLLNIWPNIFQINKRIFNYIFFAIQRICFSVEFTHLKIFLSQGLFHPNREIRHVYSYIYFNIKIRLNYLSIVNINKRIKTL